MRNMRIPILMIALCALTTTFTLGQVRGYCTTPDSQEQVDILRANKESLAKLPLVMRSPVVKYVPLTFILVADANGNGRAREEQVLVEIESLNALYAPQEMIFYLDQIKYEDNNDIYSESASNAAVFRMKIIRDPNSINVFVANNASSGGSTPGIGLGYWDAINDWLVVKRSEVDGMSGTLGHELGHFFTIPHPHLGWGCDPYDEDTHGNPVSSLFSPCITGLRVEFQDGTNCQNAGDQICDTPPDYNFGFGWNVGGNQCAPFTLNIMDPQGDVVDPMENNIMSYFLKCTDYMFTETQQNLIQNSFFGSNRSYIRTGYTPNQAAVDGEVEYLFPINGEESPSFEVVDFDWEDTPGATHYLFIIDRFSTFSFMPDRVIVEGSALSYEGLEANRTYFWKVWPFNDTQTGAGYSATQSFITGTSTAVNDIRGVQQFDIYPNPALGDEMMISIESTEAFEATIEIIDLAGHVVHRSDGLQVNTQAPMHHLLNIDGLARGLYVLHVRSSSGILSRKFSIQ